jgi:hypothetical protein
MWAKWVFSVTAVAKILKQGPTSFLAARSWDSAVENAKRLPRNIITQHRAGKFSGILYITVGRTHILHPQNPLFARLVPEYGAKKATIWTFEGDVKTPIKICRL